MIDCLSSPPLPLLPPGPHSSLSPDSRKIKPFVADGFRKQYMGQAKISGHSVCKVPQKHNDQ